MKSAWSMLNCRGMKAAVRVLKRNRSNFYTSSVAPVGTGHEIRFRALDMVMLCVLFLELALAMRWCLAN